MNKAELTTKDQAQSYGPLKGKCCVKPGEKVKGTYFFGGAGLDGAYIEPLVRALRQAGIKNPVYVDQDKWSAGIGFDAAIGSVLGREYDPRFPMRLRISDIKSSQFNLIGYSYGSIVAAQLAAQYAKKRTVIDHLVLIGSPISRTFLERLHHVPHIKKLVIINLDERGDPIYAGMGVFELFSSLPRLALQMPDSEGHFYFAHPGQVGDRRRKALAEKLYKAGLR